jgi:hypothetical protein
MKRFALVVSSWLLIGTVVFAFLNEIRMAIWMGVAASFFLFVTFVEKNGPK